MLPEKTAQRTNLERWRIDSVEGAHRWRYIDETQAKTRPQTRAEKWYLGLAAEDKTLPEPKTFADSARNGWSFYQSLQFEDGHWGCGYGGPSFLLPGLVFAMYISGMVIPQEWKTEMIFYLQTHANDDGGWGLHLEGPSTVLATGLYYVMLRILGLSADHPLAAAGRRRLHQLGGAIGIPQWGKMWLSCLNLFSWDGVNPIPPEFWLLPEWLPFHPSRWWIQCRVVYLPTSFLYSKRFQTPLTPLLEQIRDEIYLKPYREVNFYANRNTVAQGDLKIPHTRLLRFVNVLLTAWETYLKPKWLTAWAERWTAHLIEREDNNTDYNCLAPVNKAFHLTAVTAAEGRDSPRVKRHQEQLLTYLWIGDDGMTSSGTNGIQLWDTAFSAQAAADAGLYKYSNFRPSLEKTLNFLDISQFRDNLTDPYRHQRKGGWPFSTRDNGYIVSDCAAEGLKATIVLQTKCGLEQKIDGQRQRDCIDTLLTMQNKDGGFASYEQVRGSTLLEYINPAEVFDRIMVEYSYPECTSACLTAFAAYAAQEPLYRTKDVKRAISGCVRFILKDQRKDGSWYGAWGVCFTYAGFLASMGLSAAGHRYHNSEPLRRSCRFLVQHQREDGGWGEHHLSCEEQRYVDTTSQVVNTAWACLALMYAEYPEKSAIERGLRLLQSRQQPNGEWLQELVEGVFNRTCMIGYPNYKLYFPVWALGRFATIYLPALEAGNIPPMTV